MVTAIDSNILLDVMIGQHPQASIARDALRKAASEGPLLLSRVCYAELAGNFATAEDLDRVLADLGIVHSAINAQAAFLAGQFAQAYRLRGGSRTRILADFLIAAHAQLQADRLLTRDARFFGESFPALKGVAPDDL
jgi:predicted nucleic acid-binding protein